MGNDVLVIAQSFVKRLVGVRACKSPSELRHVGPIVDALRLGGAANGFQRKLIEPRFRHLQWTMRAKEADRHEERLLGHLLPFLCCPLSHLVVAHLCVRRIERIPIIRWPHRSKSVFPLRRFGISRPTKERVPDLPGIAVEDLAPTGDAVTVIHEILLDRWRLDAVFPGASGVEIGPGLEGVDAVEQARPRRATLRRVAVRLREQHAA